MHYSRHPAPPGAESVYVRRRTAEARFALRPRQRRDGEDHHAARRLGVRAQRAAEGRSVQLRLDEGCALHLASGVVGRDLRHVVPAEDHVHRCGDQEEVVLRVHPQRQALSAHRFRQGQRGKQTTHHRADRIALSDPEQLDPRPVIRPASGGLQTVRARRPPLLQMQHRAGAGERQADRAGHPDRSRTWRVCQRRTGDAALHRA